MRATRLCALAVALGLVLAGSQAIQATGSPRAHAATTCSDFPNQAAAQRAHNTRDADHDGIYCEDLPCPCLKPGATSPSKPSHAKRRSARRPALGASVPLARVRKRSDCRVRGPLPDPGCTPGATYRKATAAKVCRPGYSSAVRNVSERTKDAVYAAYGMRRHFDGRDGEVDHLVSLELGGSNSRANLFPEAAAPRPGSHEKDRLENELHDEVCSGRITLRRAQKLIAVNWVAAYRQRFGRG
jgi:hypothetical protein